MREATIFIAPDYQVKSVTITNGGSGYTSAPTVTFTSNDAGYGATGIAKLSGDAVRAVQVTNPGQGYTEAPTITLTGGGGIDAAAVAVLNDGIKFNLDVNKNIALLTEEGYGLPPIEYITQRGPFQHGESLRDYFLRPRVFQLLIRRNSCSRDTYWDNRLNLLDILRPNRTGSACAGQGILRRITSDGRKFDINVIIAEGLGFAQGNDNWDRFAYQEVIRLVAHDPVFFNPTVFTTNFVLAAASLVFGPVVPPATTVFPITFGYGAAIQTIVNHGTWHTYPQIQVNGPLNSFVIMNNTINKQISLAYDIPVGAYVLIGLEYGRKYIQLNDGTNLIGYASGDIATFRLDPGTNELEVRGTGFTGLGPHVVITYNERYYGI